MGLQMPLRALLITAAGFLPVIAEPMFIRAFMCATDLQFPVQLVLIRC